MYAGIFDINNGADVTREMNAEGFVVRASFNKVSTGLVISTGVVAVTTFIFFLVTMWNAPLMFDEIVCLSTTEWALMLLMAVATITLTTITLVKTLIVNKEK